MTMQFFTREWHQRCASGEVDEAAAERLAEQYADHLADLWDLLPSTVRQFADEVDLHDATIRRVEFDADRKELLLELRGGDEDDGFFDVTLRYDDAVIERAGLDLLKAAQGVADLEILYDELDADGPGRFVHRILFAPDGEIEIAFETLLSTRTKAAPQKR